MFTLNSMWDLLFTPTRSRPIESNGQLVYRNLFLFFDELEKFIHNQKELQEGLLASTLIKDSKQGGPKPKSKKLNTLFNNNHLAKARALPFAPPGIHLTEHKGVCESLAEISQQISLILQWISWLGDTDEKFTNTLNSLSSNVFKESSRRLISSRYSIHE